MELEVLQSVKIKSQDLHGTFPHYSDPIRELEQYDDKATRAEMYQNRLAQWTFRQLKKMGIADKKQEELDHSHLQESLQKFLEALKGESDLDPAEEAAE